MEEEVGPEGEERWRSGEERRTDVSVCSNETAKRMVVGSIEGELCIYVIEEWMCVCVLWYVDGVVAGQD